MLAFQSQVKSEDDETPFMILQRVLKRRNRSFCLFSTRSSCTLKACLVFMWVSFRHEIITFIRWDLMEAVAQDESVLEVC